MTFRTEPEFLALDVDRRNDYIAYDAMVSAGVDNWGWYGESVKDVESSDVYKTATRIERGLMLFDALEAGGVDNWEGYPFAFEGVEFDDEE